MADDAWIKLKHQDDRDIWGKVAKNLEFRPSVRPENFPGFNEPTPSLTYSFSTIWGEDFDALEHDMQAKAHQMFKNVTNEGDYLYALDWQHTCYRFFPHKAQGGSSDNWEIPVLPNGDYYLFLEPTLKFGWLGHPWEQTICIFGDRLLKELKHLRPKQFRHPVRQKG